MRRTILRSRFFLALVLAGLLTAQLPLTAFADTAAETMKTEEATPAPAVDTYTMGSLLIEIEKVDIPAAAEGLSFNGKEQPGAALPELDKKYKLRSGTKSAVKPGNYSFELELAEPLPENIAKQITEGHADHAMPATPSDYTAVRFYLWKDGTSAPKAISWSIAALKAKAPEGKKLEYNGKEQSGAAEGKGYTLSGDKAVKPGNYKATAKLSEGYVWEDGSDKAKEIEWSIAALKVKAPEGKSLKYTGKELIGVEDTGNGGYTLADNKATKAGKYKAVAKLSEGYVWEDGSTKDLEIEWSIVRSSSSSGGGSGGSSGTGQKGLVVVRPDGSVSTYGSVNSGSSYSNGSGVVSPGANAGSSPSPAASYLVPGGPAGTPATPAPGSLSQNTAVPSSSKLPQNAGTTTPQPTAAAANTDPKPAASSAGSSGGQKSPSSSGSTAPKTAAQNVEEASREHTKAEETKISAENETLVAAGESSVIFEFTPSGSSEDNHSPEDTAYGTMAVSTPDTFMGGLMSVLWKVLAVLGVLGIAGGVGYMIYNRKHTD